MSAHSPEPWFVDDGDIMCSTPGISIHSVVDYIGISEADQERIVACVNACKGIEDPVKAIPALYAALKASNSRLRTLIACADGPEFVQRSSVIKDNEAALALVSPKGA